jgi:LacI family transcriptional regulator
MPKKIRSVKIQDVAKAAGVSVSTVSRVLNQKVDVSEETRQRILEVIQQLGYSSSLAARSMRSRSHKLIGLIVPDMEYPYSLQVAKGVNHAIASSKYDLLIYTTGTFQKEDTAQHEQHYVSLLNGTITDGVILLTPSATSFNSSAPMVSIDPHVLPVGDPTILPDHYAGALEAMRYLVQLGHRRIAYITGRVGYQNSERYRAYCDSLAEADLPWEAELVQEGNFSVPGGQAAAERLFALPSPPSAIFAANDQTALGVMQAVSEAGLRIPHDLSLVGYDDIPEARYLGLTTVNQPLEKMGELAVELLIQLIEGQPVEHRVRTVPTSLVVRHSCGAWTPARVKMAGVG